MYQNWEITGRYLFMLAFCLLFSGALKAQLDEQILQKAVQSESCATIADQLDSAVLNTEKELLLAGICLYKSKRIHQAIAQFDKVYQFDSKLKDRAAFWLAKCHALNQEDSLVLAYLNSLPESFLNYRLLLFPEFEYLAETNEQFSRLLNNSKPGLTPWTFLLASITVLGFLLGFLLLFSASRFTRGRKWLVLLLFTTSTILLSYLLYWTKFDLFFPYLKNTWQFLTFFVGPSVYFYLKTVFKVEYDRRQLIGHLFFPFMILLLTLPATLRNFGIRTGLSNDFFSAAAASELLIAHLVLYTVLTGHLIKNDWQVDDNIKKWSQILHRGFLAYTLAFLSYFVLVKTSFFSPQWDYAISLVMAAGILTIAYMGLIQKQIFSSKPIEDYLPVKKYQTSMLTDSSKDSIKKKINHLLNVEKVFKENELRLDDLAAYANISRHQLSQVINERYGLNFFELINSFRVKHVKTLLADEHYDHYTIQQIAFEAGFNNKASFNRYFKKASGLTPSAYRLKMGDKRARKKF